MLISLTYSINGGLKKRVKMSRIVWLQLSIVLCGLVPVQANQGQIIGASPKRLEIDSKAQSEFSLIPHHYNSDTAFSYKSKLGQAARSEKSYFLQTSESKGGLYYRRPINNKSFLSRFFVGNHFSAQMDAFQNSEIPFLARGSGVATEVSTQSTQLSASYFKSNTQNEGVKNAQINYKHEKQPLTSDTKLALAIPFLPQLKLFGGYSYSRNSESRLTKGPSFGFQAALFGRVKVDTTFVKQTVGKTAARVLLSFNMPIERFKF